MSNFKIDANPTTKIFSFFKKLSYSFEHALAEFLDNSVESFRNNKLSKKLITVIFDAERNRIIIRDTAAGISDKKFPRAVKLQHVDEDVNGLSEFGMGLKTAGFWMGDEITIITKSVEHTTGRKAIMSLKKFEDNNEINVDKSDQFSKPPFLLKNGTIIVLDGITKKMTATQLKKIIPFFSSKYRNDIAKGIEIRFILNEKNLSGTYVDLVEMYFTGKKEYIRKLSYSSSRKLEYKYPDVYETEQGKQKENFSFSINWKGEKISAEGWIANKANGGRKSDVGFSLMRRGTVIIEDYKPEELFGGGNSFETLRMFGEIVFSPNIPVTQAKDKFDWSDGLEEEIIEVISNLDEFNKIRKLAKIPRDESKVKMEFTEVDFAEQKKVIENTLSTSKGIKNMKVTKIKSITTTGIDKSDFKISIETESGPMVFISRLSTGQEDRDWIKVDTSNDIDIVSIDMSHPFFNPFNSEDKEFINLLRNFSISFAISMKESMKHGEDAEEFKDRLGDYLGRKHNV